MNATLRPLSYGDKIFVRLVRQHSGMPTLTEFTLTDASSMNDVYGELRRHTQGMHGLTQLYMRNVTRGWSLKQPFKLYGNSMRSIA